MLSHAPSLRYIAHSLEFLCLERGRFKPILNYLRRCSAIRHVGFINANMTNLFWGLDDISDNVIELNFSKNKLTSLSTLYEVFFAKLERLQLRENAINSIDLTKLHLPVLKVLDIEKNCLIQLDNPSGLVLGSRLTPSNPLCIYMEENLWHCNRTFNWLIKYPYNTLNSVNGFIFVSQSKTVTIMEVNRLICESPPNKQGVRIIDDTTGDEDLKDDTCNSTLCGGYPVNMMELWWLCGIARLR